MGISLIYVKDENNEEARPIVCFAENRYGFTPASVPLHHVIGDSPFKNTISVAQGASVALSTAHSASSDSIINAVITAYIENATPPEYIDFFVRMKDDYGTLQDMVFQIGRSYLLDPVFDVGSDRVYSALQFSLPYMEAVGQTASPTMCVGVKLPAAWANATALQVKISLLGMPEIMGP